MTDKTGWQPIATAPRDGGQFLTWTPDTDEPLDFARYDAESDAFVKWGCGFVYATHWMPLPEPPAT